tara:strand:- start:213 stop:953 length:741 start_codon:yes stop_codon:yes gene_type:complete
LRVYKVNRIEHRVYEQEDAFPHDSVSVRSNWKDGQIGDWVLADDDCIIQVLRRGKLLRPRGKKKFIEYIGTCTGTFLVSDKSKMDTSKRVNIYSFSGEKSSEDVLIERKSLNTREKLFITYYSTGMDLQTAYMKAFPTNKPGYAKMKATQLLTTKRIRTAMKEELKPICEELGINEEFVLTGIKSEAELADKADTRLKALFKLSDILDMEDKHKVQTTQMTGIQFSGFDPKQLSEASSPKLKESNE